MSVGKKVAKKERKFVCYNALEVSIRRSGIFSPGAVTTIILEAFLEDSGRLVASKVVSRGVCKEGEFWAWRKMLIEKGWLIWNENQADKGQYFPGKKLFPYINKEKITRKELVTKDEVLPKAEAATKAELQDLKARMSKIESAVQELQETYIPPENEEKREKRKRIADKLHNLSNSKVPGSMS
jgi:hypothetical protein